VALNGRNESGSIPAAMENAGLSQLDVRDKAAAGILDDSNAGVPPPFRALRLTPRAW